jgi:hypothetical protein
MICKELVAQERVFRDPHGRCILEAPMYSEKPEFFGVHGEREYKGGWHKSPSWWAQCQQLAQVKQVSNVCLREVPRLIIFSII